MNVIISLPIPNANYLKVKNTKRRSVHTVCLYTRVVCLMILNDLKLLIQYFEACSWIFLTQWQTFQIPRQNITKAHCTLHPRGIAAAFVFRAFGLMGYWVTDVTPYLFSSHIMRTLSLARKTRLKVTALAASGNERKPEFSSIALSRYKWVKRYITKIL